MPDAVLPRRELGTAALMFTGLSSIIGSGWLFGGWHAAQLAGTGAIWAWVIGAAIILTIALCYAELGAMFPESGGTVRYSHYSHGSLVGFVAGCANWIVFASAIAIEAEASVQYMASWPYAWAQALYVGRELSVGGLAIAAVLVLVYFALNYWGVKWFARANSAITWFKLIVPTLTGVLLLAAGFHAENFSVGLHGGHTGVDLVAVLTAVATSGIVFSYNGFQSPVNLAGEARNPARSVPWAVLGSILLSTALYLLLQIAFLAAVPPDQLGKGWAALEYSSPLAQLALALNLNWLAVLLYADAFVSPSGAGITYVATTGRMIYAMERSGTVPAVLGRIHAGSGVPRAALWFNLGVAFVFLFFFRGWNDLAAVISVAIVLSYLAAPLSAMVLRRTAATATRPLRIPGLNLVAPLAFVASTLLLYWARWPLTGQIILLVAAALPVYFYYQQRNAWRDFSQHLRGAAWLLAYLPTLAALSWAGSAEFGGRGWLPFGWDFLIVGATGLAFYAWGLRSGWHTPAVAGALADAA